MNMGNKNCNRHIFEKYKAVMIYVWVLNVKFWNENSK